MATNKEMTSVVGRREIRANLMIHAARKNVEVKTTYATLDMGIHVFKKMATNETKQAKGH